MPAKKSVTKSTKEKSSSNDMDKMMVDNFIALQKVLTNLAVKFDKLSDDISKLLNLFEISAKSFAEKNANLDDSSNKELKEKLDQVLEQNKVIAKGLTLIEDRVKNKSPSLPSPTGDVKPRPLPRF